MLNQPQPTPSVVHVQQPAHHEQPFYVLVGSHKLGFACGPYLISALSQLPLERRVEVISSMQAWAQHSSDAKEAAHVKARLTHTLQNLVGASSLSPTYAPFHGQDPAWALFRALPFPVRALVEYSLTPEMLVSHKAAPILRDVHRSGGLPQAEAVLTRFVGKEMVQGAAEAFAVGGVVDWGVRLTLDKEAGTGFVIKHEGPMGMRGSSTFMHRAVGGDRFMRVQFSNRRHWWSERGGHALQVLAQEGIHFACRRYKYINHKLDGNGVCYFVAEDSTGKEEPGFRAMSAQCMIAGLGNFFNFPCIPRLVARVALGFSRSQSLSLEPRQIELIDDMFASEDGAVMTDGSGFISPDLVARLPPHLYQGRVLAAAPLTGPALPVSPFAVIQVRVICHLGGFKGTLLVHPRLQNKVQLRRSSMLKFPPPNLSVTPLTRRPSLDVLTTFRVLKASTRLSRELLLVLRALEVPDTVFLKLVEDELSLLHSACTDADQAAALLRRSSATLIHSSAEWQIAEMLKAGHGVKEAYIQKTLLGLRGRALIKLQQGRVFCPSSLYLVGQPDPLGVLKPDEVYVCHGLPAGHEGLPEGGTEGGVYEGRVLLARHPIHKPAHMQTFRAVKQTALQAFLGPRAGVLFFSVQGTPSPASRLSDGDMDGDTYFVCMHKEIVATARPNDSQEVEKSNSSSSSSSGGGSSAIPAAPSAASSPPPPPCPGSEILTRVGPFRFNAESIGLKVDATVMKRCLESCVAQGKAHDIVTSASDWWLRHADLRGARSPNCVILGDIVARALDSAKTGLLWSLPTVLKPAHRPAYLGRSGWSSSSSFSPASSSSSSNPFLGYTAVDTLLGRIHARVAPLLASDSSSSSATTTTSSSSSMRSGKKASAYTSDGGNDFFSQAGTLCLDSDLRVEGSAAFLEQAQSWLKAYRQSFARRMGRRYHTQQQQHDDPGEYQALKSEVLASLKQAFHATAARVEGGKGMTPANKRGGGGGGGGGGGEERRPLQLLADNTLPTKTSAAVTVDEKNDGESKVPATAVKTTMTTKTNSNSGSNSNKFDGRRLAVASAIYEVTYMSGSTLSFVWDTVMHELNHVKKVALARKEVVEKSGKEEGSLR